MGEKNKQDALAVSFGAAKFSQRVWVAKVAGATACALTWPFLACSKCSQSSSWTKVQLNSLYLLCVLGNEIAWYRRREKLLIVWPNQMNKDETAEEIRLRLLFSLFSFLSSYCLELLNTFCGFSFDYSYDCGSSRVVMMATNVSTVKGIRWI